MRMTSTGAFPRALAAASPPNPPPTITARGVFDLCSSAPLIELRLASFMHPFLKLATLEISENLVFLADRDGQVSGEPDGGTIKRTRDRLEESPEARSERATGSSRLPSSSCEPLECRCP